ncbi:MAG: low molecular weight protein-tyrosine-phosphatase, partial [Steroidobacteraceae bacterium]
PGRRAVVRVLFVDAGNYCRSPAAEVVARALIGRAHKASQLEVGSAGLKDKHVGDTADPRTIEACAERGYDLAAFRCRQITAADFARNDLILAMDRENLMQLETQRPAASRARIELFLGGAEVPDPYFGEADGFRAMMDQIEAGAARLLKRLTAEG